MKLGCIADDFTGATDLANNLVRAGMRTLQTVGVPRPDETLAEDAPDAVVVALKSRTIAPEDAVAQSIEACRFLRAHGAQQIYFKVCSTFDSTPRGNIGPVLEALMDELGCEFTIATPAFPVNGRTVYKGHLFVGDLLLSDSGMRHHPLTPMTDSNLVRVLQAQLHGPSQRRVGLISHRTVGASAAAVVERFSAMSAAGCSIAIADALCDDDLLRLGRAARHLKLVCAGSGLAIGLPANFGVQPGPEAARLPAPGGRAAIVSGSCSEATQAQVEDFIAGGGKAFAIDPIVALTAEPSRLVDDVALAAAGAWQSAPDAPVLVYTTASADAVAAVQARFGVQEAGQRLESVLGEVVRALVERGARRLVIAGGETSGACVQALGIRQLRIGPQIDPGVPWCHAPSPWAGDVGVHLALKSGNFGARDFFTRAFSVRV